jgi:tetratricopeptide (TPR) repeat protein
MNGQVLFRSEDVLVRHVRAGAKPSAVCFVTFGSYTNDYTLDREGFGEEFLRREGIDAIHVINRDNRWYQYREMDAALVAVASVTAAYPRVFTYGSSMGGYAALRFARAVGAATAIAISPQFSLDPRVVPFETRWQADLAAITFREGPVVPAERQLIFVDPKLPTDAAHVRLFAELATETVVVNVPHAGHPVGAIMAETGVLKRAIRMILRNRFDKGRIERALRNGRRRSPHYYFTLARRAQERHPATAIALLRRAVALRRESHTLSQLATMLDLRREHGEAASLHAEALALVPGNAYARVAYAMHLEYTGQVREASAELGRAAAGQGPSVKLMVRTAHARFLLRRWGLRRLDRMLDRWLTRNADTAAYARVARRLGRIVG